MKNMKKLLGAMAALGFTTVAAVNVVACSNKSTVSNDLTKSFESSYSKAVTVASDLAALGLVVNPTDNTKYTFTFANITNDGITNVVKAKLNAPVKKGLTVSSTLPTPAAEADEIAQVTQKTANGDLKVSSDAKKTISYTVTLKLFKAIKQSDNTLKYIDQSTSMDVTLNIDTVATKIDITGKITSPQAIGTLAANTAAAFLANLQTQLVSISGLSTITTSDYDVYQTGTKNAVDDAKVVAGSPIAVDITAKGDNFTGSVTNISVTFTPASTAIDITGKITSPQALGTLAANTAAAFLASLQTQLASISGLSTITTNDYNVFKTGTQNAVDDAAVQAGSPIAVDITAQGDNFTGSVTNISVTFTPAP